MAYEKLSQKKILAVNLGSFIDSQIMLITQNRQRRNLEDESKFNRAVLEDDLTLEQQLDYRKAQLKRVLAGDREERRRIKDEISTLKDLQQQKQYNDEFLSQIMDMNSGAQSIDRTITWLNDRLAKTTDMAIQKSIKENISQLLSQRYELGKTTLTSQTEYANNDKTVTVIDTQIDRINNARVEALRAGNDDYVAMLDLQLQSLNKTKTEANIQNTILNFSVATMTGQSATSLLNQFNGQIQNADSNTPITIGGTTYDNAKQFWELKRADYLNDRSENGFFNRYQTELSEKINYKASRGILINDSLADVKAWYEELKNRPEMAEYQDRVAMDQQSSLQETGNLRAENILNEFAIKLDVKKAISELAYLQDTYGIDQKFNYQKLVSSAAKEKADQIAEILSTMEKIMLENPGVSNQQALEQAIQSGAGATYSPEELATTSASDLITGMGEKATAQQFGEEKPALTTGPEAKIFQSPDIKDGELVKMENGSTVYKYENGQLRAFVGNWNEDAFKQYTGKGFAAVTTVPNISGLQQGAGIKVTDIQTLDQATPKYTEGSLLKTSASPTIYRYEQGKLRPFTGSWDEQKFKQYTGQGFSAVKTVDSINDLQFGKEIKYQ